MELYDGYDVTERLRNNSGYILMPAVTKWRVSLDTKHRSVGVLGCRQL